MAHTATILCPSCHQPNQPDARFCAVCGFDMILNNHQPTSDDRRYVITRVLKHGGQGSVYEGIDQDGQIYAIKELRDEFTDPEEKADAARRFNIEADLLQNLTHPRIPRVYSHFTDEERHYLTMDFVQGEDLETLLEREGRVGEPQVLAWAMQICDVLAYLHDEGVIYRDVKPSNVMIEQSGDVKLVDFGIAKVLNPGEQRGTQIGTPGYAPPEQYQGLATRASDIYALAATLHHLLTGRDPTTQTPFSFPPARDLDVTISRRTSDALEQALQFQASDRFQTIPEFRAMLRPLLGSQPLPAAASVQPHVTRPLQPDPAVQQAAQQAVQAQRTQAAPPPAQAHQRTPPPMSPAPPLPIPQPAPTAPSKAAPAKRPARLRTCAIRAGGTLLALLVLAGGLVLGLSALPALDDTLPALTQPAAPELGPLQPLELPLEVTLPADADEATIQAAFRDAYRTELAQTYAGSAINETTITMVGGWEAAGSENGQTRYTGIGQAFVQLPVE